jgi:hypothetical protein
MPLNIRIQHTTKYSLKSEPMSLIKADLSGQAGRSSSQTLTSRLNRSRTTIARNLSQAIVIGSWIGLYALSSMHSPKGFTPC